MLYRCQVVLKHASGLPLNNVTNTFWVDTGVAGISAGHAEAIAEDVRDFYVTDIGAGQSARICEYLNNSLAEEGHEIKVTPINLATGVDERGLGFPALHTEVFDFIAWAPGATGLPNEVACCLSYKNTTSGAVPPSRRRGRVYIGPLSTLAQLATASAWRPATAFREDLVAAADALRDRLVADARVWVVYSRPYPGRDELERPGNPRGPLPALPARAGAIYPVDSFWVDDAFDTQRKRGERATLRTIG